VGVGESRENVGVGWFHVFPRTESDHPKPYDGISIRFLRLSRHRPCKPASITTTGEAKQPTSSGTRFTAKLCGAITDGRRGPGSRVVVAGHGQQTA